MIYTNVLLNDVLSTSDILPLEHHFVNLDAALAREIVFCLYNCFDASNDRFNDNVKR